MIKQWIGKHPFWAFYIIAFSLSTILWGYLLTLEIYHQIQNGADYSFFASVYVIRAQLIESYPVLFHHQDSIVLYLSWYVLMPLGFPMLFFPLAPTISALTISAINSGKKAVVSLLKLYKPVQGSLTAREGFKIYFLLMLFLTAMVSLAIAREYYWGEPERVAAAIKHLGLFDWKVFLVSLFMALFVNQGALLEELGWRGYALPLMIKRWGNPLLASILLGIAWALWHFPREIPMLLSGQQDIPALLIGQFWFIFMCINMSIIATYFVNITGGSVLPAIIIHGTLNMVGGMFNTEHMGLRSAFSLDGPLMWFSAAIVILLLVGTDLGWKRRQQLLGNTDA